jgi:hypothetical protein
MVTRSKTDPPTDPPSADPPTDPPADEVGELRKMVTDLSERIDKIGDAKSTPRTQAAIEDDMEGQVRAALTKITKHDELTDTVGKLRAAVLEKPPVKQGRLEKLLWGARS